MKRSFLLAVVSAFVYVNSGRNFMDDLFNANVEVLAEDEALEITTCYIDGWTGDYAYVLFCASSTSVESKCYNK